MNTSKQLNNNIIPQNVVCLAFALSVKFLKLKDYNFTDNEQLCNPNVQDFPSFHPHFLMNLQLLMHFYTQTVCIWHRLYHHNQIFQKHKCKFIINEKVMLF